MKRTVVRTVVWLGFVAMASAGWASGVAGPVGAERSALAGASREVKVAIDGFIARTEVSEPLAGTGSPEYSIQLPAGAALAEASIEVSNQKQRAEAHGDGGNNFSVGVVRAGERASRVHYTYYQTLALERGAGEYRIPIRDATSIDLEFRSPWPVTNVAAPGHERESQICRIDEGQYRVKLALAGAPGSPDFVLQNHIAQKRTGSVELLTYRPDAREPGTFMVVLTPGHVDLRKPRVEFMGDRVLETAQIAGGDARQIIFLGRYRDAGATRLTLTSADGESYNTLIDLPETDTDDPEIARLWAANRGPAAELKLLGNERQLAAERAAQAFRAGHGPWSTQVDMSNPMFSAKFETADSAGEASCGCVAAALPAYFGTARLPRGAGAVALLAPRVAEKGGSD